MRLLLLLFLLLQLLALVGRQLLPVFLRLGQKVLEDRVLAVQVPRRRAQRPAASKPRQGQRAVPELVLGVARETPRRRPVLGWGWAD